MPIDSSEQCIRIANRRRLSYYFTIAAIALFLLSMFLPAWTLEHNDASGLDQSFYWSFSSLGGSFQGYTPSLQYYTENYWLWNLPSEIQGPLYVMLVMSLITIFTGLIALYYLRKNRQIVSFDYKTRIALVIAGLMAFTTPVTFFLLWPSTVNNSLVNPGRYIDFFGDISVGGETARWGGGLGWWLQIVGFTSIFIAILLVLSTPKQQQIDKVKQKCPGCNHTLQNDWNTCPYCNKPLKDINEPDPHHYFCENCSHEINKRWTVCPYCSRKLVDGLGKCAICGTIIQPGTIFCPKCSHDFSRQFIRRR